MCFFFFFICLLAWGAVFVNLLAGARSSRIARLSYSLRACCYNVRESRVEHKYTNSHSPQYRKRKRNLTRKQTAVLICKLISRQSSFKNTPVPQGNQTKNQQWIATPTSNFQSTN